MPDYLRLLSLEKKIENNYALFTKAEARYISYMFENLMALFMMNSIEAPQLYNKIRAYIDEIVYASHTQE